MGIRCIRSEVLDEKDPIFVYQNMITSVSDTPIAKEYEFLERIGKGSFAEVYRAKYRRTQKLRAVKKIERRSQKIQTTLFNEFSILREMDHPSILKMYELYKDQNFYYITTELCTGQELFEVIMKQKVFKESMAKEVFFQILSAVKYMHENHSVMHRDLKPENIIYDIETKSLKIVDFGSSIKFESSDLVQRKTIGTSYYIAPEVLKKLYNERCDVWSLGVILYILLCGEPPFKGKDDSEGKFKFRKSIWKLVSDDAKDLLLRMLDCNPLTRPSALEVAKHRWFDSMEVKADLTSPEDEEVMSSLLENMKRFKDFKSTSIQEGMLVFIVNFVQTNQSEADLVKHFKALDLNSDGVLSLEELKAGLSKYLKMKEKDALHIAQKIFEKVDTNHSGAIDYSEFLIAASNIEIVVSEQNLDLAFEYLDEDRSGTLSTQEIRKRLGQNVSEEKYEQLIEKFDKNKDGVISREEFKAMMKCLLKCD